MHEVKRIFASYHIEHGNMGGLDATEPTSELPDTPDSKPQSHMQISKLSPETQAPFLSLSASL